MKNLKILLMILFIMILPISTTTMQRTSFTQQSTIPIISASTLQSVNGSSQSLFGNAITSIGNYDGSGYPAFAVGGCQYNSGQGRVWIYFTNIDGIESQQANVIIDGESNKRTSGICFGQSIANVGDVNGDNITDFVVGAPGSNGAWTVGKAYLFFGHPNHFPTQSLTGANQAFVSPNPNDLFGTKVAYVNNFNGDNYSDLAISAPGTINGQSLNFKPSSGSPPPTSSGDQTTNFGSVYLYYGNGTGYSSKPDLTLRDNLNNTGFGLALATGDLNGDGLTDIIVGAPNYNNNVGRVDIFYGKRNETNKVLKPDLIINASANQFNFGHNVALIPDISKGSFSDLLINYNTLESGFPSKVSMYVGSTALKTEKPTFILQTTSKSSLFGTSIVSLGDINNDSFNDFSIGIPGEGNGTVYVYYGGYNFSGQPSKEYIGETIGDEFGYSIAPITYNNTIHLLVGALNYDGDLGRVYITLKQISPKIIKRPFILTQSEIKNLVSIGFLTAILVVTINLMNERRK